MRLIVFSNPTMLDREVETIHALFEAGMERFHLRKPDWDRKAYKSFLHHIDVKYHPKISIHAHHDLIADFNLGGIHFTERHRESLSPELIRERNKGNLLMSTSFHQLAQLAKWEDLFDYAFLSPIFNSISKQGYDGVFKDGVTLPKGHQQKLIGLGGIRADNVVKVVEMGFDGIAVLGAIWQTPQLAVESFKALQKVMKQVSTYSVGDSLVR